MIIDFNKSNGGGGDLSNYYTSAQTDSHIQSAVTAAVTEIENELSDFVTSGDVETQITSKGYATVSAVTSALTEIENELSDFVTSGDVETQILSKNYATVSAMTSAITAVEDELSEAEQVTATALVDINSRMVSSELIKTIVKMTQAEYNALTTKDNNTLYIIV